MKHIFLALIASLFISCTPVMAEDFVIRSTDVTRVYDGDTFFVNLPYLPKVFGEELGIRLLGIDTPEYRSSCATAEDRAAERALATAARLYLEEQIRSARYIELTNVSRDKYFRLDSDVLVDGVSMSKLLIEKGYGIAYEGDTKISWCGRR